LIAVLEVATGKVIGQTRGRHRNEEFRRFLNLADGEGACGPAARLSADPKAIA
jgi:hypothetical protein